MSINEAVIAFTWLYGVLSGDSQLTGLAPGGVFRGMADLDVATPFVVFALQSANDVTTINGVRILVDGLFQVKAVGETSKMATTANAASRIDALIGSPPASGTVTGGYIAASYRQSPLSLDELVSGVKWTTIGGLYRIQIEQTS